MSDKPESIPYITPELDINVAFWAIDKADATKITSVNLNSNLKLFEFHSTRSLIVCADRDSRITIWDYSLKKVITNIYLFDIFSNSHSSSSSSSSSDNVNDSVGVNATLFIRHRMARDSNQSYRKDKLRTVLQESKQHHKGIEESTHKKTAIDSIKQISFVDRNSIQFNTGDTNTIPLQRTFNSSNMIMIVSDIVTFYDYLSHNSRFLGVNELGKRSSAADFISYNICAIGGVDGNLRLWDCHSWSSVKLITIPIKGEIAVVKTIPVQR